MVSALLMLGIAGVGFAGEPWLAFVFGAFLMVGSRLPDSVRTVKRYAREPSTDIFIGIMIDLALNVAWAFASAWAGYGLRLLLLFWKGR